MAGQARRLRGLALALLLALPVGARVSAAGIPELATTDTQGFAAVRPDQPITFPADHAAHPAFRIEWWYVTANLQGEDGRQYGVQWTLFRSALAPPPERMGWENQQIWFAHAAVTTPDRHLAAERFSRGGIGQAGVALGPFRARIDGWRLASTGQGPDAPFSPLAMTARAPGFGYDLKLTASGPEVLEGDHGYSVKSAEGQASHYYSNPFLDVTGTIRVGSREVRVSGKAWLDREWSTAPLSPSQTGWDWFALRLRDGPLLMLYRLRDAAGGDWVTGNLIGRDGSSTLLRASDIDMTPEGRVEVAGRRLPLRWHVRIPSRGIDVETRPLNPGAWNALSVPYWEGPVEISGSAPGEGYLELTGY